MHETAATAKAPTTYRERLSPSLWVLVSAAVSGPMVALVLAPLGSVLGMIAGAVFSVLVVASLVLASPVVEVDRTHLRVGRARIELGHLGEATALHSDDARQARGPGLSPGSWHLLRGGIDGVVRVEIIDPDDPVTHWVFSSRTPDRIVALITARR